MVSLGVNCALNWTYESGSGVVSLSMSRKFVVLVVQCLIDTYAHTQWFTSSKHTTPTQSKFLYQKKKKKRVNEKDNKSSDLVVYRIALCIFRAGVQFHAMLKF